MRSMFSGIILAGGKSRRMGESKAFLEFRGKPLIRYPLDILASMCSEVLIVTKEPEQYGGLGARVITDLHADSGPMAGIYAGLSAGARSWSIVLACDLPFVRRTLLEGMAEQARKEPHRKAVIPLAPKAPGGEMIPQVLCAAYSRACLSDLEKKIAQGRISLRREMKEPEAKWVPWRELDPEDVRATSFINLNTPEEYEKWAARSKT